MSAGYDFVPLPPQVYRAQRGNDRHDRRMPDALQAIVEVRFRAEEPVHVGMGSRALLNGKVIRQGARILGKPGIPGSSMRGVLRARLEAISKSCCLSGAPKSRQLTKSLPSTSYPEHHVQFSQDVQRHAVFKNCEGSQLCLACCLFGRTTQRSRLSVRDLALIGDSGFLVERMPQLFSPRPHHLGKFGPPNANKLLTVTRLYGRKFYVNGGPRVEKAEGVEVIPVGAVLAGTLSMINATQAELGALLAALGHLPRSFLKLGSGKAHGFGRLRLTELSVRLRDGFRLRTAAPEELGRWREAFLESPDRWPEGETALVGLHGGADGGER